MKKIKDYVKKNPEPARGRFGINASDPWSAKYNVAEDLTTNQKSQGDSRSKIAHSPTKQRAAELEKSAKFYKIPTPTGSMGSKIHHEEKNMKENEKKISSKTDRILKAVGNQNTALTPEGVQMESKKKMSALDKWRKGSYEREKAHNEFMKSIQDKPHAEKMKAMTDKMKSNLNMEDMNPNSPKASGVAKELKNISKRQNSGLAREETYMDAKAATPAPMSPGEGIEEKMTTVQRIMALKKKKLKEDMYDHEKEDKSVATYGKKPKFEKAEKDNGGENKPSAAAVMTGGTTLTGSKRDTVEIDPMMRNRPGQPDVTKKDDKKDGKDKDKKKDK
jgi:hypothetical protein